MSVKKIEPQTKSIGKYLDLSKDNTMFNIPEYQRAYSWGKEQCDRLWQDVCDFVQSDNTDSYFFGTIIINCQDDNKTLSIIDGQQRTTTFLLLLKALLISVNDAIIKIKSESSVDGDTKKLFQALRNRRKKIMSILYKIDGDDVPDEPSNEDKVIYEGKVINNSSINELYKDDLGNILCSCSFEEAEKNVKKFERKQKDNKYTNFFRNFKFFYEIVSDLDSTILNGYTKKILEECEVIEIRSWQEEQAIMMFNSLNSTGQPLTDADIISARFFASADKKGEKEKFKEIWEELHNLVENLEAREILNMDSVLRQQMYYKRAVGIDSDTTTPGLRKYYTELNRTLIDNPFETCNELVNLTKVWDEVSRYPIAKLMFKIDDSNSRLFLASYLYRFNLKNIENIDKIKEDIETVFLCMIRLFAILELVDAGYSNAGFKGFLFKEILKLVNENISVDEIKSDFNDHIKNTWKKEYILECLCDYKKHRLIYLNEYLVAKEKGIELNFDKKCDIEHIMPASGKNIDVIRKDAKLENVDDFKEYVNKLGNKILLEITINRSISNKWFRQKLSTYKNSVFPIAGTLVEKYENEEEPKWTKDEIKCATEEAAERIAKFIFGD